MFTLSSFFLAFTIVDGRKEAIIFLVIIAFVSIIFPIIGILGDRGIIKNAVKKAIKEEKDEEDKKQEKTNENKRET